MEGAMRKSITVAVFTPSLGPGPRHHLYEVDLLRAFATISP